MVDFKQSFTAQMPRVNVAIPASIYVNGRQIPPIESDGIITRFSCSSLHICCEKPVPIPSKGVLRFSFETSNEGSFEMDVEFKSCFKRNNGFWSWGKKDEYEMQLNIPDLSADATKRYQHYLNQMIYGNKPSHVIMPEGNGNGYSY